MSPTSGPALGTLSKGCRRAASPKPCLSPSRSSWSIQACHWGRGGWPSTFTCISHHRAIVAYLLLCTLGVGDSDGHGWHGSSIGYWCPRCRHKAEEPGFRLRAEGSHQPWGTSKLFHPVWKWSSGTFTAPGTKSYSSLQGCRSQGLSTGK
jgi:hypothetical protein